MLAEMAERIRDEITDATGYVADRAARAARGGALIGGALGGLLGVVLLALGFIIGKVG